MADAQTIPLTSGKTLLAVRDYLTHHHGEDAIQQALSDLRPQEQRELGGIVLPTSWYPTTTVIRLIDVARARFGPADFCERYGEWSARFALNLFYRFLLRFKTPDWVMQRAMTLWRDYHTTGVWETKMTPTTAHAVLRDFAAPGIYCRVLMGWLRAAGRMTGATNCEVVHPRCRAAGSHDCLFVARWGDSKA